MADELKKKEQSNLTAFDDGTETIDSIEKTVADLKRKIQELSNEERKSESVAEDPLNHHCDDTVTSDDEQYKIPDFVAPPADTEKTVTALHTAQDAVIEEPREIVDIMTAADHTENDPDDEKAAVFDDTKESFTEKTMEYADKAVSAIKEHAEKLHENKDIKKTLDYIKQNAVKVYDTAVLKLNEIKQDPKVQEVSDKAENTYQQVKDYIVPKSKKMLSTMKETTQDAVTKVNTFVNRPDVQDRLQQIKNTLYDAVDKGIKTVRKIIGSKDTK